MFTGWLGLLGHWNVLLCRISLGEGMLGPIGVNQRSSRTSSTGFFDAWAVLSTVFMVHTCHSMKLFDLGKWVEDVKCSMQWCWRNCVSSSDEKGWPLSIESKGSGPYRDMTSSRHTHREWADLVVETLYKKGHLLNRLQISRYSLP